MKSLRLPQVFLDAPSLPGIVKDAAYHTGPLAILRCLGRNKRTWFEHKADERFEYAYSDAELYEIARRVKQLKEAHDEVCVLFCNRPAPAAIANALQLGRMLA